MKRILLLVLSATTFAGAAQAADIAPYSPAMPAFSWSGVYGGANIGYGWGEFDGSSADIGYTDPGDPADPLDDLTFLYPGFDGSLDVDGVVGGLYGGANFEIAGFVFGLDADYSWSGITGDASTGDILINDVPVGSFGEGSLDVDWLAHVRGRIGYGFDRFMLFFAGGLAVAGLNSDASYVAPLGVDVAGSSGDDSVTGWTIGGGIEWAATDNLIVRAEYLYDQFDDVNLGSYQVTDTNFSPAVTFPQSSVDGDLSVNIFRVGVSWKFGSMF
jgi:outer membrane immunogenic protein